MAHHQLIREPVSEIRALRRQLNDAYADGESAYESNHYAEQQKNYRLRQAEYALQEAEREAENARYNAEMYAEKMAKSTRAREMGDEWSAQRHMQDANRWYRP